MVHERPWRLGNTSQMMRPLKPLKTSPCVVPHATLAKELRSFLIGLIQITARKKVSIKEQLLQSSEKRYKGFDAFIKGPCLLFRNTWNLMVRKSYGMETG